MTLGICSVSAGIVSPNQYKTPNNGICPKPLPSPQEVMRERTDRFIKQNEEKSIAKDASERNIGDWFNVANNFFRNLKDKMLEAGRKY